MIPPNPILRDGTPLSAWINTLAPERATMEQLERLAILDQVVSGLVMLEDGAARDLLIEYTSTQLNLGKQLCKRRLAGALVQYRMILAEQDRKILAAAPVKPPREQFEDALAGRRPYFAFLLDQLAPHPGSLDDVAKLKAADQAIAVLLPLPDAQLQTLLLKQLAGHLDLGEKLIRDRFRDQVKVKAGQPASGPQLGGEVRDGGFHQAVIGCMSRWLARLKITPDAVSGWLDDGGKQLSIKPRELVHQFHYEHASFFESLPRDRIDITLNAMMHQQRQTRRQAILSQIIGKPASTAGREELRKWLIATTRRDDPVDFAVMLHWLWQVKRLNAGQRVAFDMMVILVGKQGKGKSVATEILCRIWQELALEIDAETIVDRRSTEVLGDYAIGRWEEMSGGSKAEVQKLKQALSAPMLNYRELGGHNHNRIVRRMAFIGTSNNPVRDVIQDPTGSRRFYEILLHEATDREALNACNTALIWEAVSENDPPPYEAVADQVAERQKALVHQDSFDFFLEWCEQERWQRLIIVMDDQPVMQNAERPRFEVPAYSDERGYSLMEIGVLFKHYSRLMNLPPKGDQWLSRRLGESGWVAWRPRLNNPARARYYRKPLRPVEVDQAEDQATGPTRGEKFAAVPAATEDLFAKAQPGPAGAHSGPSEAITPPSSAMTPPDAVLRQPGDDEDEPPWRGGSDDIPL